MNEKFKIVERSDLELVGRGYWLLRAGSDSELTPYAYFDYGRKFLDAGFLGASLLPRRYNDPDDPKHA